MAQADQLGMRLLPERQIPTPEHLSPIAQMSLSMPAIGGERDYPPSDDITGWRDHVRSMDELMRGMMGSFAAGLPVDFEQREIAGVTVYIATPRDLPVDCRGVVLDFHGGALILGGGDLCRDMAAGVALRLQRRVWSVDYRMPPDHPYPAGLDDCLAVYRAMLGEYDASEIVIEGGSAGGNLAAATVLRARDEGLPMPAGVILGTPECDLTESGDSFHTNVGLDAVLKPLMPVNLLYANGHSLTHPYLSPLFADYSKGFPPTILSTGTRDLFLSNTVRMHRALRDAGIAAELHVLEAAGHVGFPMAPEGAAIDAECRRFIDRVTNQKE